MTEFILLLFFVLLAFAGWRFYLHWTEEKLRKNPPKRRVIEVSLPGGTKGSPANMARFYRKISSAATGDAGARKIGARQIDFVYLAEGIQEGAPPRLRCFIYADPDQMDTIKRALKSTFHSNVDVIEVEDDELQKLALTLRPPEEDKLAEAEQVDVSGVDMESDDPQNLPPGAIPGG